MRKVGDLSRLHDRFFDRGFRVLAIADEPLHEVQARMREAGATYWIGVDPEQKTLRECAGRGTLGLPRFFLVDDEGIVVGDSLPDADEIEELLDQLFDPDLGRELAGELEAAREQYRRGAAGAAWEAAARFLEHEDPGVAADAEFLQEKAVKWAGWRRGRIERSLGKGEPEIELGQLLQFEARFAGMPEAAWAAERIAGLEEVERIHDERFAWRELRKGLTQELDGSRSGPRLAVSAYKRVVRKFGDSHAAGIARERLAELGQK